jgi:hypothetical protein
MAQPDLAAIEARSFDCGSGCFSREQYFTPRLRSG